jgi:hypothetical protein
MHHPTETVSLDEEEIAPWSAETRFPLARVLWDSDRDRPRAVVLARHGGGEEAR